jgi:hypothetical protein
MIEPSMIGQAAVETSDANRPELMESIRLSLAQIESAKGGFRKSSEEAAE